MPLGRILVVEDEPSLARYLQMELEHEGYRCRMAHSGPLALQLAQAEAFDLVLLDLMLPDLDGLEVCRRLRRASDVPIIMITARDAVADRIAGLDTGADDYLTKPFAIEELLARMRAVVRRRERSAPSTETAVLAVGALRLSPATREVRCAERVIALTKREFDLLEYLMENAGRVCNRDQIMAAVWGYDSEAETNVVDVYVRYLRRKLGRCAGFLRTVRGVGYLLREDGA
ncbi:MAG: response regulator transcription factor [Clostridia bacterium]|nr:response regulator transcription factor [Clostridia bacterium]